MRAKKQMFISDKLRRNRIKKRIGFPVDIPRLELPDPAAPRTMQRRKVDFPFQIGVDVTSKTVARKPIDGFVIDNIVLGEPTKFFFAKSKVGNTLENSTCSGENPVAPSSRKFSRENLENAATAGRAGA
jgi:hypothetical protein